MTRTLFRNNVKNLAILFPIIDVTPNRHRTASHLPSPVARIYLISTKSNGILRTHISKIQSHKKVQGGKGINLFEVLGCIAPSRGVNKAIDSDAWTHLWKPCTLPFLHPVDTWRSGSDRRERGGLLAPQWPSEPRFSCSVVVRPSG